MNKSVFLRITKHLRNFVLILVNKEFLIFLFFLALSGIFWLMMTLNETYENEIYVPLRLVNVPKNAIITSDVEDTICVTVRDKGFSLIAYEGSKNIKPVIINFDDYANEKTGHGVIPMADIQRQVIQQLFGSSKITSIKPDKFEFYFNYGRSKKVPIRMFGHIVPGESYYLAHTKFWPDSVTVYASRTVLDSIKYVYTQYLDIVNFADTVVQNVSLRKIQGAKCVPSVVRIGLYPDILTEESMDVPITAINVPKGRILRMFPSRVKVNFVIGASMFRSIRPEHFKVVADYNELTAHPSDKCNIYLRQYPHGINKATLAVQTVDYLIEQQ
jgi:hypothetical protein